MNRLDLENSSKAVVLAVGRFFFFPLQPVLDLAARRYSAGPQIKDAFASSRGLPERSYLSRLEYRAWNGCSLADCLNESRRAVSEIKKQGCSADLLIRWPFSLKNFEKNSELLELLVFAKENEVRILLDRSQYPWDSALLDSVQNFIAQGIEIGLTLPARWDEGAEAVSFLKEDPRLWIRLIEDPCSGSQKERQRNWHHWIERLAGGKAGVSLASQDFALVCDLIKILQRGQSPRFELEFTYGMLSRRLLRLAKDQGVPVRVHIPYGKPYLPYSPQEAWKKPRVLMSLLRDFFCGA